MVSCGTTLLARTPAMRTGGCACLAKRKSSWTTRTFFRPLKTGPNIRLPSLVFGAADDIKLHLFGEFNIVGHITGDPDK